MCGGSPNIPQPKRFQAQQAPTFRETGNTKRGRRGTNLTKNEGISDENKGGKKTLLGQ